MNLFAKILKPIAVPIIKNMMRNYLRRNVEYIIIGVLVLIMLGVACLVKAG